MARPKGSKNAVRTKKANIDYAAIVAEKAAEESKKAEAESVLKKLLASGMSADEIVAKLQ